MKQNRTARPAWMILGWIVVPVVLGGILLALDRTTLERGNRLFRDGRVQEAVDVYRSVLESSSAASVGDPGTSLPEADPDTSSIPPSASPLVGLYNLGTAVQVAERGGGQGRSPETGDPRASDGDGTTLAGDPATYVDPATYLEATLARGDSLASEGALEHRDSVVLQRAHYNLGARYLEKLEPFLGLDSAFLFASAAVAHNREALYRNPTDENARWNLALAQRSLDSLLVQLAVVDDRDAGEVEALEEIEFDSGIMTRAESSNPDALPPPEGVRPDPDRRQVDDESRAQAAIEGAREALEGRDPGLIDRARALETLEGFRDNPELVVRGILWVQRPDVVWWDQTPYPGGDW